MLLLLQQFVVHVEQLHVVFSEGRSVGVAEGGAADCPEIVHFLGLSDKAVLVFEDYIVFLDHCIAILHVLPRTWQCILREALVGLKPFFFWHDSKWFFLGRFDRHGLCEICAWPWRSYF